MTGHELKAARLASSWTQNDAAAKLGVTQAYLSMVERGTRPVSRDVAAKAVHILNIPATALPLEPYRHRDHDTAFFERALGNLGYSGFAYLRRSAKVNPTELLMEALDSENLASRVVEALPWLPAAYPEIDWTWLTFNAKVRDRQNRLAYVTLLAAQIAEKRADSTTRHALLKTVNALERSRLEAEDTLCRQSTTLAERNWLRTHRPAAAKHWNLLTDLCIENLEEAWW
jgi:transcriptional regulator with XRE-family HTH domain